MVKLHGYLFAKLHLIGSKSEGPSYFLQLFNYKEISIIKKTPLWEDDLNLHPLLGRKVVLEGNYSNNELDYLSISPLDGESLPADENSKLILDLMIDPYQIVLNPLEKPPSLQFVQLTLSVLWPYRSIWSGVSPTSQLYEFFVEYQDKTIWRWGEHKTFAQSATSVQIMGGTEPVLYNEVWIFDRHKLPGNGAYTIKALFIPSQQIIERPFVVADHS